MPKKMILLVKLFSFLMLACTKPSSAPTPLNPNIEYRVLDTSFSKYIFVYDFDYNGVEEMTITARFKPDDGSGYESASASIYVPNGFVQNFDMMDTGILCRTDTLSYVKKLNFGDSIYYKTGKWIAGKPHGSVLNLFIYEKFEPMNINKNCGYYNAGDLYLPIRFYAKFDYGEGWYNAWLLINASATKLTVKSVAWYKTPETPIKAGEK
jgi:hypothetical protein